MPSYTEAAAGIAREAGALIDGYLQRHIGFELKGEFDLVTEADRSSERLIVGRLKELYPDPLRSSPKKAAGRRRSSEFRWYVDPLDGTTNFAHGFPAFNVTLGAGTRGRTDRGRGLRSYAQRNVLRRKGRGRVSERPADPSFESANALKPAWSPPDSPRASGT